MKSRNSREGHYCGRSTSPDGKGSRHVRSKIAKVSAGTATLIVVRRLASKFTEQGQMDLMVRIMDEDEEMLGELGIRRA
jgi:hypothetical protein